MKIIILKVDNNGHDNSCHWNRDVVFMQCSGPVLLTMSVLLSLTYFLIIQQWLE